MYLSPRHDKLQRYNGEILSEAYELCEALLNDDALEAIEEN